MNRQQLISEIKKKQSFLCVGLDTDPGKIPPHLLNLEDSVFEFNKQIIDHTHQYVVAYKPNTAFYEAEGMKGWISLQKTIEYLKTNYPEIFIIADAKRGDIGNTSKMYAKAFLDKLKCDAVTVAPYMGEDSVMPFMGYENKWVVLLVLTSNKGAFDFQFCDLKNSGKKLYEEVISQSLKWGDENNMMYVVGATKAEYLKDIRNLIPDHFLLIPGVGAQGGSLTDVFNSGANKDCGLLVNSSRAIIYADNSENFAKEAAAQAEKVQLEMAELLKVKKNP